MQDVRDKQDSSRGQTSEDKTRIVMESLTTNITEAEPYRKYNLKPNVIQNLKHKFMKGTGIIVQDLVTRSTRI